MMKNFTLSVMQLNNYIKNIFDAEEMLIGVSVFGEVSNFKLSGTSAYFDLKEEGASLSCVMFSYSANIKNGDKLLITGRLNFHVKLGKLSFIVQKTELQGQGQLYQQYLELKAKLESEGLFDERNKKSLPKYAKCIGVITSKTGAVIQDIINVTKRKNPFCDIVLYPVAVQGQGAENEIIQGITYFNERSDIDVIILARGGGSFEDFAPFNTELLARKVYLSTKPIISAIGHETDFSLTDFTADMRAPTPSVAAELAVFSINDLENDLHKKLLFQISKLSYELTHAKQQAILAINDAEDAMSDMSKRIKDLLSNDIAKMIRQIDNKLQDKKIAVDYSLLKLEKSNPITLIRRGFCQCLDEKGNKVLKIEDVQIGDELKVMVLDGSINTKVINMERKNYEN